jgi:tRNA-binding EMAP/Myf-like protein
MLSEKIHLYVFLVKIRYQRLKELTVNCNIKQHNAEDMLIFQTVICFNQLIPFLVPQQSLP